VSFTSIEGIVSIYYTEGNYTRAHGIFCTSILATSIQSAYRQARGMMQGKDMLTLWILFCCVTEKWDTLFTFYARDREDECV
jgi:hypothetical protein